MRLWPRALVRSSGRSVRKTEEGFVGGVECRVVACARSKEGSDTSCSRTCKLAKRYPIFIPNLKSLDRRLQGNFHPEILTERGNFPRLEVGAKHPIFETFFGFWRVLSIQLEETTTGSKGVARGERPARAVRRVPTRTRCCSPGSRQRTLTDTRFVRLPQDRYVEQSGGREHKARRRDCARD